MESLYWLLVATIILVIFILLNYSDNGKNHPPGPRPWPIIGNFNLIGTLPHISLHRLSQKYGKLMYLKFGSVPVVVVSSPDMAQQFLRTHDHIFASRPTTTAAGKHTTYNYRAISWAPYGPYWSQARKIYLNELFSSKRLDSYEYIRVEERNIFLSRLHKLSGDKVVLKEQIAHSNLSMISRILLGRKYFSESNDKKEIVTLKEFQEILDEWILLNGVLNIGDWIPWMEFMDLQGYVKRMKAMFKRFDRFNEHVLQDHMARMKAEKDGFVAKDMVDSLLKLVDDPNLEVKLDYDCVKGLTQDLLVGGTDTSATVIEWAMSELMKQPSLIKKATQELDRVIGKERWVDEHDHANLPFIDSVIKETMRLHPVTVILAPHAALQDCKVAGYDIAKGTTIFVNLWAMGRDSNLWDDPECFRPERFLGKDIDMKGQHFELLPFGSGRRMCPGYNLGLKITRSLLANMLHGFNWTLPDDMKKEDINMDEIYGLSTHRKFPLVAVTKPRLPDNMFNYM
ncbi:flavonoid 3'-monooxygenase-like protein [Tanacetum coccineum]|uniref:Flavonoid 3'-monooxygenase-like protein n=1 Tax=Tanacetum coccineum TaxID=301880 RepID=A0ABQ5A8H5_9ASTR